MSELTTTTGEPLPAKSPQPFKWRKAACVVALHLAESRLSYKKISNLTSVSEKTIWEWAHHPEFAARVLQLRERIFESIVKRGIAAKEIRIAHLREMQQRMRRIVLERAEDMGAIDANTGKPAIPGGSSGLLVRRIRKIGHGESAERIEEFEVDVGLIKELREYNKQIAIELGQWTEKKDITSDGQAVKVVAGINMDEI